MDPFLEEAVLKQHYEGLAQSHLTITKKTMIGKANQTMSISKPIFFGMLIGEQAVEFYKNVDALNESFKAKNDASIDLIVTCLLYMFRVGEFLKIGRKAIEFDKSKPEAIKDESFWNTMQDSYVEREKLYVDCVNNLLYVLNTFIGEDWQSRMPKVSFCFDVYVNYWNSMIDFD